MICSAPRCKNEQLAMNCVDNNKEFLLTKHIDSGDARQRNFYCFDMQRKENYHSNQKWQQRIGLKP